MQYGWFNGNQGATLLMKSQDGINWEPMQATNREDAELIVLALNAYADPSQKVNVPDSLDELAG
jgi:hypothetical protein